MDYPIVYLYLIALLFTAVVCVVLIPFARKIGLVDHPGERKVHEEPTPLTGGVALLFSYCLMLLLFGHADGFTVAVTTGGMLMFTIGLIDDYRPASTAVRFVVQTAACVIVMALTGMRLDDFGSLFWGDVLELYWFSVPITLFAALGVINSFNLIDGMDGLAGSVFLIAAGGMVLLTGNDPYSDTNLFLTLSFFAVVGYLLLNARFPWNSRARVFMGDSGSMLLGFVLAWSFISLGNDSNEAGRRAFMPMTAVWLFAIPLMDTTTQMWRRIRAGESVFAADQYHLHHIFLRAGFSVRQTWLSITSFALVLALIGLGFEYSSLPDYFSFWTFIVIAFSFHSYVVRSWKLQRFLNRHFVYNDFGKPS